RSISQSSVLPLRGVAQTRYAFVGLKNCVTRALLPQSSLIRSGKGYTQMPPPNIVYLHSHDTGRYVQPYGHQIPTPNIQRLADQGLLFRQAFCAAPTCSGSRACLLTGQWAHVNGMTGLAHRGWKLRDYGRHIVHPLREVGYWSALVGEQHVSAEPSVLGYDHVVEIGTTRVHSIAPAALQLLRSRLPRPFF